MKAKKLFIFKTAALLRQEDMKRLRVTLIEQIESGVVILDGRTDFVGSEIKIEGCKLKVELVGMEE